MAGRMGNYQGRNLRPAEATRDMGRGQKGSATLPGNKKGPHPPVLQGRWFQLSLISSDIKPKPTGSLFTRCARTNSVRTGTHAKNPKTSHQVLASRGIRSLTRCSSVPGPGKILLLALGQPRGQRPQTTVRASTPGATPVQHQGWVVGTAVKRQLGMSASHFEVPGFQFPAAAPGR